MVTAKKGTKKCNTFLMLLTACNSCLKTE